jgi:hypothetical protein
MKIKNKSCIIIGVVLLIIVFITTNIFASNQILQNVNINFEKEYYSTLEDNTIFVNFEIINNNNKKVDLYVFLECEDEDIECDYSKNITLDRFNSRTDSFVIRTYDEGSYEVILHVRDADSEDNEEIEFSIYIDVEEDNDEGDFKIDFQNTILCYNKTNFVSVEIDNNYKKGLYNLSFDESVLSIYLNEDNPVYLPKDEKTIQFIVEVPKNFNSVAYRNLNFKIQNNEVTVIKEVSFSFKDCLETEIDFAVSNASYESYSIKKEDPKTITYNIVNNSSNNKFIYIAGFQEQNNLEIIIPNREIEIPANSSKKIDLIIIAPNTLSSGDYDMNLSFFDTLNTIYKKLKFKVDAEHNISSRLLQTGSMALKIGTPIEVRLIVENNGDIVENINISTDIGNDLHIDLNNKEFRINPGSVKIIVFNISAGSNTEEKRTSLQIEVQGENSNYLKRYNIDIVSFRDKAPVTLDFLSIPNTISLDNNRTIEFEIEVTNFNTKDLILEKIEFRNIPQEITYSLPENLIIKSKENKIILGSISVSNLEPQEIESSLVFISNEGGVLEKKILLKINILEEESKLEEETKDKTKNAILSGLVNLKGSIFGGIIIICLLIIFLFATNIIKKAPLKANN